MLAEPVGTCQRLRRTPLSPARRADNVSRARVYELIRALISPSV